MASLLSINCGLATRMFERHLAGGMHLVRHHFDFQKNSRYWLWRLGKSVHFRAGTSGLRRVYRHFLASSFSALKQSQRPQGAAQGCCVDANHWET